MPTFLLTWKPTRWVWGSLSEDIRKIETSGSCVHRWSTGSTKRIALGDRVFMLRQGSDRPGIMGSGVAASAVYSEKHFDPDRPDDITLYIDARFDTLLDPNNTTILDRKSLYTGHLSKVNWNTQASGMSVSAEAATELELRWATHLAQIGYGTPPLPEEVPTSQTYYEGATKQIFVNAYERNVDARRACLAHYGIRCMICSFDFEVVYGVQGRGFIHVHHLVPLADIGRSYQVDPIDDLRPVCANCHAMIHRGPTPMTIEDLQAQLRRV